MEAILITKRGCPRCLMVLKNIPTAIFDDERLKVLDADSPEGMGELAMYEALEQTLPLLILTDTHIIVDDNEILNRLKHAFGQSLPVN